MERGYSIFPDRQPYLDFRIDIDDCDNVMLIIKVERPN